MMRESFAEVSLPTLLQNYETLAAHAPVTAVVKANAYGHGAERVARALWQAGCQRFAVATAGEGVRLRRALPRAEILVLGPTPLPITQELVTHRLTQTLYNYPYAVALARTLTAPLRVALKLETGMHRYGFATDEHGMAHAREILAAPHLSVAELFSHPADLATDARDRFAHAADFLDPAHNRLRHFANTATALADTAAHFDTIRCGIGLYGYGDTSLTPVLSLYSRVATLHHLRAGDTVGYGCTFTAMRPTTIAAIPIGYADGFLRAYSGASVYIGDTAAPIVGTVCMDACMADVTEIPNVRAGAPVTIWDAAHPATAVATHANTIVYESLTVLSPRIARRYITG